MVSLRLAAAVLVLAASSARAQDALPVQTERSRVSYTGTSVLHTWTGRSAQLSGTVRLDAAAPARSAIRLRVPVASFDSGIGARDRKMRQATAAERFPDVVFVSRTARPESWAGAPGARRGRWRVAGDLTFRGVTRPVEALVDVREDGNTLVAEGGFEVSLTAHGVDRPRLGPAAIGDTIRLAFAVVAAP